MGRRPFWLHRKAQQSAHKCLLVIPQLRDMLSRGSLVAPAGPYMAPL